jgi:hypothetical protein
MKSNNIFSNIIRANEGGGSANVYQIGDNNYQFDVFLWNGETKVGLTFPAVEELKIVDDLRYFYSYGYMLFSDFEDVMETFTGSNSKPYNFRGDGRDYLQVEITPQIRPDDDDLFNVSEREKKEFTLKYTFSIYKIDEELKEDRGIKYKKVYFWDVDYQLLNEIDARSSSSEVTIDDESGIFGLLRNPLELNSIFSLFGGGGDASTNNERNLQDNKRYTGDILKYVMDKSLNKTCQSGFKASKNWDKGGSLIEFHTNGVSKAIDDISYIINYHTSVDDNSPCILKKMSYTDEYTFIPVTRYLNSASSENFVLGKMDAGNQMGLGILAGSKNNTGAFNANNYNIIEQYSLIKPESNDMQSEICTHFVHSYDPNGFFTCSIKNNNIKETEKSIFGLFSNSQNNGGSASIPINQIRKENFNVQHKYASGLGINQDLQKMNAGKNKSLLASVFKNTAIYFRIRGLTKRKSGTKFTINRNDSFIKNQNDEMILGDFLTTVVIHDFSRGSYFNHIYATKQTSENKIKFAEML